MPVRPSPPPRETEDWLTDLGRLYFGSLPYDELVRACSSAANELLTSRHRTPNQRYLLGQNISNLLREIADRATYRAVPGSMEWDVSHCNLTLAEAGANGLAREHAHARYYVLQWALRMVCPDDPHGHQMLLINGRYHQISTLSHQSDEDHKMVIAVLSEIYQDKATGDGSLQKQYFSRGGFLLPEENP